MAEIPSEFRGRYFYHFTHIDNILSIIEQGGLLSTNEKERRGVKHHDIANQTIQGRRSTMFVPVGPGGVVHDYVPFYFASVNPMLLSALNNKRVDQPYVCVIAVSIEKLLKEKVVFTDAAANTTIPPNFYEDPADLTRLDWGQIDSRSWGGRTDEEQHAHMAEALVHRKVPLDWIDSYIVFNQWGKQEILCFYQDAGLTAPAISYDWFNNRPFFYTKYFFTDRKNETLVTGPILLYEKFTDLIDTVIRNREDDPPEEPQFQDIADALDELEDDFCAIPELEGIYGLKTDNPVHRETVDEHTVQVVANVKGSFFYGKLGQKRKNAVCLAAYLHDIGKGPESKWAQNNGIQKAYPDHPADAIPMLGRILSEDFEQLSENEIRWLCLLVVYHDLMGDIIRGYRTGYGRSEQELRKLDLDIKDLYMLAALSEADVCSLREDWFLGFKDQLKDLIEKMLKEEKP